MLHSTNHEHFLDKNQTPLPQDIDNHDKDTEHESSIVFSSQKTMMDYVTLEGIENRTGVGKENVYGFILKELLDNAVDFLEIQSAKGKFKEADVNVTITKDDKVLRIIVRNSNNYGKPSFSKDKLQYIFNFDTFYSSKRNQYKITRGALGDAFKEILCIPYTLARKYNSNIEWKQPLTITTAIDNTRQTFLVSLKIDRINQAIQTEIEELNVKEGEEAKSNFTEIEVRLPVIEDKLYLDKLRSFLINYATLNTHIGFTFNLPIHSSSSSELDRQQISLSFPKIQPINTRWTNISSIYYYSLSEFQNFIVGLDKNSDDLPIHSILQKTFKEGSNMKKSGLGEMTVGQLKQTPQNIDQLYLLLQNIMKPISLASNLSLPFDTNKKMRMEAVKKRLEQRPSFKVSDMKYKSQYGYYESKDDVNIIKFPFFFEIAVVSSNSIPYYLDFTESLNSSVMPGNYSFLVGSDGKTFHWQTRGDRKSNNIRVSRSIFDVFQHYGYSHSNDKCKKPHTLIIANLISPRIGYKSYGKSNIDLSPFADVIAETTVKACMGGSAQGILSSELSFSIIGFLRRLLKERFEAVKHDLTLKEKQKWTQSTVFYHLRPILLDNGFSPESIDRQYITSEIKNVCEQYLGVKREDLGITAADRAQLHFEGHWYDVGLEELNDLVQYGTDMLIIEKEGVVKQLAPFADEKGIALLNTRGFLTEYASILSEKANKKGCNIAILTDFDASGLLIANNIPDVYRIGIDFDTIRYFNLRPSQVEEKYNPKQNHLKPLQNLDAYDIDGDVYETVEYVSEKRIEIDSVLAAVNDNAAFWEFILSKLEDKFPTRDYNRAIDIPKYVMPSCLELLNDQVREKATLILQQERIKMKQQLSGTTGFLNVHQYKSSVPIHLRSIVENDSGIKPLLSDIESLNLKQGRGDCCN